MLNKKNIIISLLMLFFIYSFSGCVSFLEKPTSYKNTEEYLKAAQAKEKNGLYNESIDLYLKYIRKNYLTKRENAEYIYKIAEIYFYKLHDFKNALKYSSILIKHYPFNIYTEDGYVLTAAVYNETHDYYKIIRLLGHYLSSITFPRKNISKMYFFTGRAYYELHKYKLSATYFNLVLSSSSDKEILYDADYLLARIYWYQYNDREMAFRYLKKLFALNYKKSDYRRVLLLFKKVRWQYINKKDGLRDTCVSAVAFDGDYIWMGLWLGGVARFTRSSHDLIFYGVRDGLISKYIRDIKVDHNDVWVATFEGISRYDKQTEKWYPYKSIPGVSYQKIKSIAVEPSYVWFGTLSRGIRRYNKKTQTWTAFPKQPKNILKIKKDPYSSKVVFGSLRKGFLIYDQGKWEHYTKNNSILQSRAVKDMAFDKNNIYIAAYKSGVYAYNKKTKKLKHLNLRNNMVYINALKVRNNKLLIGTLGDGVIIYDLQSGKTRTLSIKDGLTSDSIMTIETEKDYIWFGTVNDGVNILYWPQDTE